MKLAIAGDVSVTESNAKYFAEQNVKILFNDVPSVWKDCDRVIVNLETAITDKNTPIKKFGPNLKAPFGTVETLKEAGVTDLALSNNHIFDFGKAGLKDTVSEIKKNGLSFTGIGENYLESRKNLVLSDNAVTAVDTLRQTRYRTKTVIATPGTFMKGTVHIGKLMLEGGRYNDVASNFLSASLKDCGIKIGRMKTGTPMRINGRTVDFSKFTPQPSDNPYTPMSVFNRPQDREFLQCYITRTTDKTAEVLKEHMLESALYSGNIHSIGPRYCPSIEDKAVKFPQNKHHPLFLEPEGLNTEEYYIQGFSTSLPEYVQYELLKSVPGLEKAQIVRAGYAIEYDYADPTCLKASLEVKNISGLFFAGQINGTTGYEEAGGQGIMAGINAALKVQGKEPFVLRRDEAYIGVLIDDLITKGVNEPYRMFTSRAEYRIILRTDNADLRLSGYGLKLGSLPASYAKGFEAYKAAVESLIQDENAPIEESALNPWSLASARNTAAVHRKYAGYLERNLKEAKALANADKIVIPEGFDVAAVKGILIESSQKLAKIRPSTLGQAGRIPGITPADLQLIAIHIEKYRREKNGIKA